ncbi:MAG: hypothetical protein KF846_08255 [Cyclobacteriaceae bacterium]|nr:hypothetical protein [Cyclobacteriaceae bacterium]
MTRSALEIFLPAFILVYFGILVLWSRISKRKRIPVQIATTAHKQIQWIDSLFRAKLVAVVLIVFVYTYFPDYYRWAGPLDMLDHPVINTIGVLLLKASLVWIIVAQLNIDRSAFMIDHGIGSIKSEKLIVYAEKLILSGLVFMFFGICITISSVLTILIFLLGFLLLERLLRV